MDRLVGRRASRADVNALRYKRGRRDPKTDPRPWDGRTSVKIAGESYRQDALVRVTGRRGTEDVKMDNVELELVCEPDNAYDPHAVKVLAEGLHVGYLSKGNARTYCKRIEREGGRVKIKGFIGALEGGPIGVRVHIPHDHPIAKPLSSSLLATAHAPARAPVTAPSSTPAGRSDRRDLQSRWACVDTRLMSKSPLSMKPRVLTALLVIALFASGCGGGAGDTQRAVSSSSQKSADQVMKHLRAAGAPIAAWQNLTAANDPNELLGRPGQYIGKVLFRDARLPAAKDALDPQLLDTDSGGSVELFSSEADAKRRAEYVRAFTKGVGAFAEYNYLHGTVFVRVSAKLTPDQAKVYERGAGSL